ncbi:LOW QUALITY PROTEIN: cyclin-dependent kinase 2-interacting protein [Salarias fasciatus]|uniref:LOW QUALITY PROTEIN: cyclin-dependent kinase 2-interacting protein n=1 Tax=Salarias fasciatus TaxID=181472 RepID=UPI001176ADFE|nr:LOW QUALITY PROTEIN: cyclin-dependent kinase 2-interacting protein [Salarias fasciatus]
MDGQSDNIPVTPANRKSSGVTGTSRKVKDNAATGSNLMIRWNKLNEEGFNAATSIVNLRRSQSEQLLVDGSASASSPSSHGQTESLQEECRRLEDVVHKMVAVVTKMERLMTSQRGIRDLEEFQFGPEGRTSPLFHSWTARQFEEAAETLLDGFRQELKLKQTILQEVAHTATPDLCMVYLSCWLHQPYIPDQNRLTLEALLLETGHRPL